MEAAVRFSQNSLPGQPAQYFLKIDVAGRVLQVYNIKAAHKNKLEYDLVHASVKLPPFRAFDWHPVEESLVAVGHTGGEASLVNLRDNDQAPLSFAPRTPRSCNAVGLNTLNWLAIGFDRARNDYCLNIWDISQRPNGKSSEPLHRLASNEYISSLRFFQDQPKLIAAGVKGQFIRLHDLREPTTAFALQFGTRCVNNIAVDTQDEHYFASCLPSNTPTVSIWDRRMIVRTNIAHTGFGNQVSQADQHPEVSAELKNVVDPQGQIWGLRFSKTQRGCLGVLSSSGQLRVLNFNSGNDERPEAEARDSRRSAGAWDQLSPHTTYLDDSVDLSHAFWESPKVEEMKRLVSFDFTTTRSRHGQPRVITLTGEGEIRMQSVPTSVHSRTIAARASIQSNYDTSVFDSYGTRFGTQKASNSKATKGSPKPNMILSSSISNLSQYLQRCKTGYLFDVDKNIATVNGHENLETFWSWLRHARQISMNDAFVQSGVNFAFVGVFGFWMEEIDTKTRSVSASSTMGKQNVSVILRDLVSRMNLPKGKVCSTEYPHNRALCLYVAGLPWSFEEVEKSCKDLVNKGQHIKAAATALFAGEPRLAQRALRAKGSDQSHKMLAMALVGAQNRHQRLSSAKTPTISGEQAGSLEDEEDEWQAIVSAISEDLTDPYARSILMYVKTGQWKEVFAQSSLPLQYRVIIALRHFDDSELTRFLSTTKQKVVGEGDLSGIFLTGLGTKESVELMAKYAGRTADVQTAALGLSFEAASDRFLSPESNHARTVLCLRDVYKSQLLSCGLKFQKAQFDVLLARKIREEHAHVGSTNVRAKEQIRLICSHCNQSLAQFGHERQVSEHIGHVAEISKTTLAAEKAAIAGIVCPKCGRHLPRCGVCELWLGTPDETFSKWYKPTGLEQQRTSNNGDLPGNMMDSTVTAIGPNETTPSISVTGASAAKSRKLSGQSKQAPLPMDGTAVEVVDESVAEQENEKRWYERMHKFTVFCSRCCHGFHAEHARMWFHGSGGQKGHRVCPVPLCECRCDG